MPDPSILSRFTVVLWRPKSPGNVGSVARAMKNMGFPKLRIADPMTYDDPLFFRTEAERMAWDAKDLLASREEHLSIESALADAVLAAGTTSKPPDGHAVMSPRVLAPLVIDAARRGPVALLFGQEDIGLSREALARCQVLGSVPSSEAYPSLNLSHAAVVFLYEIRMAALAADSGAARVSGAALNDLPGARAIGEGAEQERSVGSRRAAPDESAPPTQLELQGFYERLTELLDEVGYFEGSARPHMVRELRRIFNRSLLTRREMRLLEGIVHSVNRARRRKPGAP